jgi:hypothetical protein
MDILQVYNPANAANLSAEETAAMKDLSNEQIAQLAQAYPNQPTGNAYLVYYITSEDAKSQRYPLGTWSNLNELRKMGRADILPFGFFKNVFSQKPTTVSVSQPKSERIVDLSAEEAASAEGLKTVSAVNSILAPDQEAASAEGGGTKEPSDAELELTAEIMTLENQLKDAVDKKAHPKTIKKLQDDIEALKLKKQQL